MFSPGSSKEGELSRTVFSFSEWQESHHSPRESAFTSDSLDFQPLCAILPIKQYKDLPPSVIYLSCLSANESLMNQPLKPSLEQAIKVPVSLLLKLGMNIQIWAIFFFKKCTNYFGRQQWSTAQHIQGTRLCFCERLLSALRTEPPLAKRPQDTARDHTVETEKHTFVVPEVGLIPTVLNFIGDVPQTQLARSGICPPSPGRKGVRTARYFDLDLCNADNVWKEGRVVPHRLLNAGWAVWQLSISKEQAVGASGITNESAAWRRGQNHALEVASQ